MTRLTVHVVAHEKRQEMALALAEAVQAEHLWVDDGKLGEWRNHMRAWKSAADSDATHAVILQDDAVPIPDFRKHVEAAVKQRPDKLLSLYLGTHRPRREEVLRTVAKAEKSSASWIVSDSLHWGVAVVVPVALISEILSTVRSSRLPYDQRISEWAHATGATVYYTWPSLVNHADQPTVIRGRSPRQGVRVAHRVGVPSWNEKEVRIEATNTNFLASKRDIQ